MKLTDWLRRFFGATPRPEPEAEGEEDVDPFDPFPEPVRLEITDVFDLHAFAPREVRPVVEEYLREARRKGLRRVRIIHGKGVGVQREAVRQILARTPFVEHFSDAPPEAGGWGATIARLRDEGETAE
jgi:dsDNA-specific endonuclease/ATPase MutS2